MEKAELSGSSPWELITSWFTPKILFCALNIMIGTIFVSSNLKSRTKHDEIHDHDQHYYNQLHPNQLTRPPSLLQRVRSFDFSLFPSHPQDHHQALESSPSPSPTLLQRVKSIKLSRLYSNTSPADTHLVEQTVAADDHQEVIPSKSDHAGKSPEKMKKSASMKPTAAAKMTDQEEEEDQIRPATTREGKKTACGVDEEV
ncbi:pathogen-associated molecular patterns-induced protein A70-like isoform X2 [Impatiens glandulifera]|nr:pathogen-associated molecular patterns-induced protein A70-like isoform X2 [Impatiens glandulifera]